MFLSLRPILRTTLLFGGGKLIDREGGLLVPGLLLHLLLLLLRHLIADRVAVSTSMNNETWLKVSAAYSLALITLYMYDDVCIHLM